MSIEDAELKFREAAAEFKAALDSEAASYAALQSDVDLKHAAFDAAKTAYEAAFAAATEAHDRVTRLYDLLDEVSKTLGVAIPAGVDPAPAADPATPSTQEQPAA